MSLSRNLVVLLSTLSLAHLLPATEPIKIGMIGLDTSHSPAFTKLINFADPGKQVYHVRVVAAFPGGSDDLPSSRDRVAGFTKQLQDMGVEIVDSIEALLSKVDAVLLMSLDGRKHLQQVTPVFRANKPVFIDKPLAANLTDAIAINLLGERLNGRWFSSSSLRFSSSIYRYRDGTYQEKIHGAISWSPCSVDASHIDLAWYGIHGVETLYTAMGTGCQQVACTSTQGADVVVGTWKDGRIGTFRGTRAGAGGFGLVVFGEKTIEQDAKFEGYEPLVVQIDRFLFEKAEPVANHETLEMMTFMQAAQESKSRAGKPVELSEIWETHRGAAEKIVAKILMQP